MQAVEFVRVAINPLPSVMWTTHASKTQPTVSEHQAPMICAGWLGSDGFLKKKDVGFESDTWKALYLY